MHALPKLSEGEGRAPAEHVVQAPLASVSPHGQGGKAGTFAGTALGPPNSCVTQPMAVEKVPLGQKHSVADTA